MTDCARVDTIAILVGLLDTLGFRHAGGHLLYKATARPE